MEESISGLDALPSDFAATVREHVTKAEAYLVAQSPPCSDIRDAEVQRISRHLVPLGHDRLDAIRLGRYKVAAFLICSVAEYEQLLDWFYDRTWDESRRVFLYAPEELIPVLIPRMIEHRLRFALRGFNEFGSFHKQFGLQFNQRIYFDVQEMKKKE